MIALVETPFHRIYSDELKLSVSRVEALIESYRERQRTGVIRLAYDGEKRLYMFFKRGGILNGYMAAPAFLEPIHNEQVPAAVQSNGEAYVRMAPLSPESMLMCKILLQSQAGTSLPGASGGPLMQYLTGLEKRPEMALVYCLWPGAASAILFPGQALPGQSMFISSETFQDETGISRAIQDWDEAECELTTLHPETSVDAWQEYQLRRTFADICENALSRFESMTGRTLMESLIRLVVIFAARQNLDIGVLSRRLVDHEIFSSPQEAAQTYHDILKEMFGHFSVVIGPRLLATTLREIVHAFPSGKREVIEKFALFPEGYYYG